jgi:hypothetical protein
MVCASVAKILVLCLAMLWAGGVGGFVMAVIMAAADATLGP